MDTKYLFLISLFSGWFLTGLIWTIQIVHYPSFEKVGTDSFTSFHSFHTSSISLIVVPLMLIELISSGLLALNQNSTVYWFAFGLVLAIWLSTFFLSVPAHNSLGGGFELSAFNKLLSTNWIRTILWTVKSGLLTFLLINSSKISL